MSIKYKLSLSFYALIALILISSIVSIYSSKQVNKNVDEALKVRVEQLRVIDEIRFGIGMQGQSIRALMTDNSDKTKESLQYYAKYVDDQITKIEDLAISYTMKQYIKEIKVYNADFNKSMITYLDYINKEDLDTAERILDDEISNANSNILNTAEKMLDFQDGQLTRISKDTQSSLKKSDTASITLLIISIVIGVALVIYVRKKIVAPLTEMVEVSKLIANGDLSQPDVHTTAKDEIGQLATATNIMKNNLHALIQQIQQNAEHLSASAQQLSASTEEVSATTNDMAIRANNTLQNAATSAQAAKESAKATEETASGVHRIAEATQLLSENSAETFTAAQNGGVVIEEANNKMTAINTSSKMMNDLVQKLSQQTNEIEKIAIVITAITEQTNLLALNAAIEAARAGEHGKGFAVVADEVRKLAEESKTSANQIVDVIRDIKLDTKNVELAAANSLQSVADGVRVIGEAGTAFQDIVQGVEKMNVQIEDISATAEEISASAEQVAASVAAIAEGAIQASSHIESIAAAIEEQTATMEQVNGVALDLSQSAQSLQDETQKFRLS